MEECIDRSRHLAGSLDLQSLLKYKTLVVMLFAQYCLEYDYLFRKTVPQDPSLRWDTIKEHIYVWAPTPHNCLNSKVAAECDSGPTSGNCSSWGRCLRKCRRTTIGIV